MRDLLHSEISAQATLRPDAPAIVDAGEQLTYGELEEASNRLARLLRAAGCRRGDRICVMMQKGASAVIAVLAVLKADAIWVPVGPSAAAAANRRILTACDSRLLLVDETSARGVEELLDDAAWVRTPEIGWLSPVKVSGESVRPAFTWSDLDAYSSAPMHCASTAADAAQLLFSTAPGGALKGVVVTHRNVLAFLRWAREHFETSPHDRLSWHSPVHSHLATFDMFGALGAGAALYPVPRELGLLPHRLAEFIRDAELTQWFSAPAVLSYMASFDAVRYGDFPSLRRILWSGELLPTKTLVYWMQRMPHSTFTHLYGAPETGIASGYYTVPSCPADDNAETPIGHACAGAELLVLDGMMAPLAPGDVGELYVGGDGVSPGYWRDEEKTRDAFPPNPATGERGDRLYRTGDLARLGSDGMLYHVARARVQPGVLSLGIELGDISAPVQNGTY